MSRHIFISFISVLILSGCMGSDPNFSVAISSLASPDAPDEKSYVLLPANEEVSKSDLQFLEFKNYLARALAEQGYNLTDNVVEADYIIFFGYGIGDPQQHQYTFSLPVWGQTGVSSSYSSGTVSLYGNTGYYSGTTTYTPSYGITGYQTYSREYTTYTRYFDLIAYDWQQYLETEEEKVVWQTRVVSSGRSGDLRRVMPIMIGAASDYLSSNTSNIITFSLKEDDPRVLKVKGIPQE